MITSCFFVVVAIYTTIINNCCLILENDVFEFSCVLKTPLTNVSVCITPQQINASNNDAHIDAVSDDLKATDTTSLSPHPISAKVQSILGASIWLNTDRVCVCRLVLLVLCLEPPAPHLDIVQLVRRVSVPVFVAPES